MFISMGPMIQLLDIYYNVKDKASYDKMMENYGTEVPKTVIVIFCRVISWDKFIMIPGPRDTRTQRCLENPHVFF